MILQDSCVNIFRHVDCKPPQIVTVNKRQLKPLRLKSGLSASSNEADDYEIVGPYCKCPIVQQTKKSFSMFCAGLPSPWLTAMNAWRRSLGDAQGKHPNLFSSSCAPQWGAMAISLRSAVPEHPLGEALLCRWVQGKPAHLDKSTSVFGCQGRHTPSENRAQRLARGSVSSQLQCRARPRAQV